ncbi:uncharacterized protein METZ01_LOCUS406549, partial [marine metagenome]
MTCLVVGQNKKLTPSQVAPPPQWGQGQPLLLQWWRVVLG